MTTNTQTAKSTKTSVNEVMAAVDETIEAAPVEETSIDELAEFVNELTAETEIPVDEVAEDELAAIASEISRDEAKAEAYGEQDAETEAELAVSEADKPKTEKAAKAPRKTIAGSAKKSDVVIDKMKGEALVLEVSDADLEGADLEARQTEILDVIDKMAVKVGEKAVNLVAAVNGSAKLSEYTKIATRFLINSGADGMTAKQLSEHMQDQAANGVKGYSAGTANSQSHQMFKLLPEMKIGLMDGRVMKANPDSLLLSVLREMV